MKRIQRTASVAGEVKASDLWRTPRPMFEALDAEFGFDLDCAADTANHLCQRWLGPGGLVEDALTVRWADYGRRGYLNTPYSSKQIKRFMTHAARQCFEGMDLVVCLHPYDPSVKWWEATRSAVEIRQIPHRVPYLKADGTTPAGAMFASAVTIYRPQPGILRAQPRHVVWTWRTEKAA